MSMLLYVLFLAYLYGIQATHMERQQPPPTQDPVNSLIIQLLQADLTRGRGRQTRDTSPPFGPPAVDTLLDDTKFPERRSSLYQPMAGLSSDLLQQQQKHYNSPRVLLSERAPLQPPPLYSIDDYAGSSDRTNKTRRKRYAEHKSYRGEYSVCDSQSQWVTDKTNAVDIRGRQVTVLDQIKTGTAESNFVKQYFYETKCRTAKPFKSGCRGIDDKHWNSQCKTSQTYVRALTQDRTSVGWRWIRIDTSCVCALSRKHRRT
ncbi:neurotrophin-3-like [Salmo trutta]|uniref:neurotrophin-3-like n=1 Tax=Salmo trutta TaxID=8032 RepID=UPI00112FEE70|nr:neurotrophin-3-like [Salmo trutta]